MSKCLHDPDPQIGKVCNCYECRVSRAQAFGHVMQHCIRCAGTCATDINGQLTCAKDDFDCAVLDIHHAALTQDINPAIITPALIDAIHQGAKELPKKFTRHAYDEQWEPGRIRDKRIEAKPVERVGRSLSSSKRK